MSEVQAVALAKAVGGEAWHSGGCIWLVLKDEADGTLSAWDDGGRKSYPTRAAFFGE